VNLNLTMLGQAISFAIFVTLCMKFIWPPVMQALQERRKKIADGLQASERASKDLELAQEKATAELRKAKEEAQQIIERANYRANQTIEESKEAARLEGERMIAAAMSEIELEKDKIRESLRAEVATLVVTGAEKILEASVDSKAHSKLLNSLAAEL